MIILNDFFEKIPLIFENRKLTLKVRIQHFLMKHNSLQDCFKTISFEHVDSWAKILHFRTHHLKNSTTELILIDTIHAVLDPVGFIMIRQLKIVGIIQILPH